MTQNSDSRFFQHPRSSCIHFIGIGGTGMNGVAQLAAHAGYNVTGSDRAISMAKAVAGQAPLYSKGLCSATGNNATRSRMREACSTQSTVLDICHCLKNLGIEIFSQDGSGITEQTDLVVYSSAIEQGNPDLKKAKALKVPLLHRAELLAKLCEGKEVIAVAGTAGKSTVTGLLGHIFEQLGLDPTVYCGAPVLNWKTSDKLVGHASRIRERVSHKLSEYREACPTTGNVRFGTGPWIIEADESDKSFLYFYPDHAIITNIAEDHFELKELYALFETFESQVSGITVRTPETFDAPTQLVGKHNIENINNALTLCKALGLDIEKCIEAVHTFKGIERRLERHGEKVIDDFAHSPIKIEAALEAVSGIWPEFNVVWRPHGFSPLAQGLDGFVEVFKRRGGVPTAAERGEDTASTNLFILPVYYAGGTVEKKITAEQFVEKLKKAGVAAGFVEDFQWLEKKLIEADLPVLIMGARDPELPKVARQLAAKLDHSLPTNHTNLLE